MTAHQANPHDKSTFHKWFGPNRSTHWTIAGSVAVIVLGGYLVYSNRDSNPTTVTAGAATERAPAPAAPAPLPAEK